MSEIDTKDLLDGHKYHFELVENFSPTTAKWIDDVMEGLQALQARVEGLEGVIRETAYHGVGQHLDDVAENVRLREALEDIRELAQSVARQALIDLAFDATNEIEKKAYFRAETLVTFAIANAFSSPNPTTSKPD